MDEIEYPLSLAVEDFVPVLLTTAGVVLLRRVAGPGRLVIAAAVLIGSGGFAKATAKLIVALGGPDLPWLRGLLFPLLTLGFALLCGPVARAATGAVPRWLTVVVPGLTAGCAAGALLTADALPLLVSTTVFALLTGFYLIVVARRCGDPVAAALVGVQLLGFVALGPLGALENQTVALQWVEQLSNTAAQAAFLIAAWRLAASGSAAAPAAARRPGTTERFGEPGVRLPVQPVGQAPAEPDRGQSQDQ